MARGIRIKGLSLYKKLLAVAAEPAAPADSTISLTFKGFLKNKPASRPANSCIKAQAQAASQSGKPKRCSHRLGFILMPRGRERAHGSSLQQLLHLFPEAKKTSGGEGSESEVFWAVEEDEFDAGI